MKNHSKFMIVFIICIQFSCNQNNNLKQVLLDHFSSESDSLKREAALFIIENMKFHASEIPIVVNKNNRTIMPIDFKHENINKLLLLRDSNEISIINRIIPDSNTVNSNSIIENINLAFSVWNKFEWNKNVPKNIFFEYLLPYKIFNEPLSNWRKEFYFLFLNNELKNDINSDANEIYYKIVVDSLGKDYKYSPSPLKFSEYSGYDEIKAIKQFDCLSGSYLGVYSLRAIGIPATVDFVPLWGSQNAGHSIEVFWDNNSQHFRAASGRDLRSLYPAKVFRYTFKYQGGWTEKIKPILNNDSFILNFLKNDHWIDVTHEHTKTYSVTFEMPLKTNSSFAYLCVYNYGKWQPVFWGKINENKIVFENIGVNILYRIALPTGNTFNLIGDIYKLDNEGVLNKIIPGKNGSIDLRLRKINKGDNSWLQSNRKYQLLYWDLDQKWSLVEDKFCNNDSLIIFDKVPMSSLYKLIDLSTEIRRERIFSYENGSQIWW